MKEDIKNLYHEIQDLLLKLLPDNWDSVYLYASVTQNKQGEMYFYYYPKKILKANPINCYEIPKKFGIDEEVYQSYLKRLYEYIRTLNKIIVPKWTNTTIIIKDNKFTIAYHFDNIENSNFTDDERRIVWRHKYLGIPIESMSIGDKMLIERYNKENNIEPIVYTEELKINAEDEEENIIPMQDNEIKNPFLKI